jgi:tetratricopeptide (TPR) repeat protein
MDSALHIIGKVEAALARDDEAGAVAVLKRVGACGPLTMSESRKLAILARSIDRNDLAVVAAAAAPDSLENRLVTMQLRTEAGETVADELAALLGPEPPAGPPLLQLVGALDVEGRMGEAIRLLEQALPVQPDWVAGHQTLAQLRWQAGEGDPAQSFGEALARLPHHEMLWAAWLGTIKMMTDWSRFEQIAAEALNRLPNSELTKMIAADGLSEMGREEDADTRFAQLAIISDPALDATRMRHAMRYSRFDQAIAIGEPAVAAHGAGECWAWLGAAWRLSGDPRSDWFHRGTELISPFDLDYAPAELDALAGVLRQLHRASGPPLGQSPRGGTQTPGPLLKRREPEIQKLRRQLRRAVRRYIDRLPSPDPGHPFLGRPRQAFRFEGAWSIRLRPGGRHVSHIHSRGWISSAFYVDLPAGMGEAEDRQGWLQFGVPQLPDEPSIEPINMIAPRRARLALFPSIFWHGTRPFDQGERLTVAFDVVPR